MNNSWTSNDTDWIKTTRLFDIKYEQGISIAES